MYFVDLLVFSSSVFCALLKYAIATYCIRSAQIKYNQHCLSNALAFLFKHGGHHSQGLLHEPAGVLQLLLPWRVRVALGGHCIQALLEAPR